MSVPIPPAELRSRLNRPGAQWHETLRCQGEMDRLRVDDESAWFLLRAQIEDAMEFGLDPRGNREHPAAGMRGSYRCPVGMYIYRGMAAPVGALPWLGEFDIDGTVQVRGRRLHWRCYFIEPRADSEREGELVLGCSVRSKGIGPDYDQEEQTRHMRDAIETGKRWCRQNRYTWRRSLWDTRR